MISAASRWDRANIYSQPHRLKSVSGDATPAAWAPTDKSGLLFWFKADSGVTESGGLVSQWDVQPGCTVTTNATAAGAARPTYTASALNGKPGISFPSGTRLDFGSDVIFTSGSEFSIVLVFKNTASGGTWYHVACTLNSSVTNRRFKIMVTNDASYSNLDWGYTGASGSPQAGIRASTDVTTNAVSTFINYNGGTATSTGSWDAYVNNGALTEVTSGSSQTTLNSNRLGNWSDGDLPLTGSIFEIFAYNSVLTAGERTEIDDYIFTRWAI